MIRGLCGEVSGIAIMVVTLWSNGKVEKFVRSCLSGIKGRDCDELRMFC